VNLPSKIDIINAIKYKVFIKDPFFEDAILKYRLNGDPLNWSGGFSIVFQMLKKNDLWAFKIWDKEMPNMKERYDWVHRKISTCGLPYFLDSHFVEKGMLAEGQFLNTHRMRWVDGITLHDYITANVHDSRKMQQLAYKFKEMIKSFHRVNIAHGDLQHGNIIVKKDGNLVVIDYDSMFVEGMQNVPDLIKGQAGYQHPARNENAFAHSKLDYFSELVIYLSLMVYSEQPGFWNSGTECMLFEKGDLADPESCGLFNYLMESKNLLIANLTKKLYVYLKLKDIAELVPLEDLVESKAIVTYPSVNAISGKF
jgi:serine/threonine protein kinase